MSQIQTFFISHILTEYAPVSYILTENAAFNRIAAGYAAKFWLKQLVL